MGQTTVFGFCQAETVVCPLLFFHSMPALRGAHDAVGWRPTEPNKEPNKGSDPLALQGMATIFEVEFTRQI